MVRNIQEQNQDSIEKNLIVPISIVINENSTLKQIFGDLEEWIFQEGKYQFMLNPINRRWLFWDEFHNDWEDTGYYAGEVNFVWNGNKLLTHKTNTVTSKPGYKAALKIVTALGEAKQYPVLANTLIGNERNSDIKIEDPACKALILQHAGGFSFFAIGKKDEILVNDNTVHQEGILIHDGDKISLGKTKFHFITVDQNEDTTTTNEDDMVTKTKLEDIRPKYSLKLQCRNCHVLLDKEQKFCTNCGTKADNPISTYVCNKCDTEVKKDQKFCTGCGEKL